MNEKHIEKLLRTFLHAQDAVSLLHMVPRSPDYIDNKIKKRDAARDAILSEFADLRQQRDELAEACQYFVDGWRVVPTDKIDMAYSLGDAALASIKEQ